MGTVDEIKRMQEEGKSEGEIRAALKQAGVSDQDVEGAFSRAQIKAAVASSNSGKSDQGLQTAGGAPIPETAPSPGVQEVGYSPQASQQGAENYQDMQPSVVEQGQDAGYYSQAGQGAEYSQGGGQGYSQAGSQGYSQGGGQDYSTGYSGVDAYSGGGYPPYQPYQEAMSSDLITEISDQVVSERLSYLQDKMERALNFRTVAEAKINSVDERLKRIEKVLDKMQLAILQKVGEYVTDVKDIKKEMEENRKSFKALKGHHKRRKK